MNYQFTVNRIVSIEWWSEKSAGVLWHFCGQLALIFLDLLVRFASRQNEHTKTL